MWSTIISLAFKFVDTTYFKVLWIAALCFVVGSLTYSYQKHRYEAQIAEIRAQMASAVAQQEKENAQKLSKAIEERDSANNRLASLSASNTALLDRLRKSASGRPSTESTSSADATSKDLARCRKFLLEGAELLSEGCERFGKCAADKDALIEIMK